MLLAVLAATSSAQPNFLVIVADDLGVDKLARWQGDVAGYTPVAADMPVTPTIDALVDDGVRFRNAWATPLCSPTRVALQTGRYGYRTQVGALVSEGSTTPPMSLAETTIAEALDPTYATGFFGKWHIGYEGRDWNGNDDPLDWATPGVRNTAPNPSLHGWMVFDGSIVGGLNSYWAWKEVVARNYGRGAGDEQSEVLLNSSYATAELAARASDFMVTAREPFLAVVSFNAPHHDNNRYELAHAQEGCSTITAATTEREAYRAMVECLDLSIDDLLAGLDAAGRLDRTIIFFLADNGTAADVGDPGFPRSGDGKGTPYESGIRVPLVVTGGRHLDATPYGTTYTGVPYAAGDHVNAGTTVVQPVHVVDLYDTLLALAGLPETGRDSVSFAPQLVDPTAPGRRINYTEHFDDDDQDGVYEGVAVARDHRYKLIVTQQDDNTAVPCQIGELYDLWYDRGEVNDLFGDPAFAVARDRIRATIDDQITAYEAGPTAPTHWLWRVADGPRTTGSCP